MSPLRTPGFNPDRKGFSNRDSNFLETFRWGWGLRYGASVRLEVETSGSVISGHLSFKIVGAGSQNSMTSGCASWGLRVDLRVEEL